MKRALWMILSMLSLSLAGCGDSELAKKVDGTWYAKMSTRDYQGTRYTQDVKYTFRYVQDDIKDGGTFSEQITYPLTEDDGEIEVTCKVTTSIEGEWEIIFRDLLLTYHLSTLDMEITDVDYEFTDFDAAGEALGVGFFMAMAGVETDLVDKNKLAEEIRKEIYPDTYDEYKLANNDGDGSYFEDVQVENGTLSFTTSDAGRVFLKKQ